MSEYRELFRTSNYSRSTIENFSITVCFASGLQPKSIATAVPYPPTLSFLLKNDTSEAGEFEASGPSSTFTGEDFLL
jgi:hypothetical protein